MSRRVMDAVRWCASLRHLSLLAILSWTAHAHIELAHLLGAPSWLAWALPVAIDAYVLSALRAWEAAPAPRHGDLRWALGLDAVAVAGSHAASQLAVPAVWRAAIAGLLGVVLVLVLWRVHALDVEVRAKTTRHRERGERRPGVTPANTVPEDVAPRRLAAVATSPVPRQVGAGTERQVELARQWLAEDGVTAAEVARRLVDDQGVSLRTAQRRVAEAERRAAAAA